MFEDDLKDFKAESHFMEIVPVGLWENFYKARYNRNQLNQIGNAMPLHVLRQKGVDVKKDLKINITDLNPSLRNVKNKHYHNTGDGGITLKIDIFINPTESWGYGNVGQADFVYNGVRYPAKARTHVWLNKWYVETTPLYLVSDAIDVPNGKYIISDNPSRKQQYHDGVIWGLELETYNSIDVQKLDVLQSMSAFVKKDAKNTNLRNCDLKNFIYCKKKTSTTQCTRWLQERLYQIGFLPKLYTTGWYNDEIMEAVKTFQQKYQKYFKGMEVTGLMDKITLDAICSI